MNFVKGILNYFGYLRLSSQLVRVSYSISSHSFSPEFLRIMFIYNNTRFGRHFVEIYHCRSTQSETEIPTCIKEHIRNVTYFSSSSSFIADSLIHWLHRHLASTITWFPEPACENCHTELQVKVVKGNPPHTPDSLELK